jgi:DNA-binding response OmpR family regulator
MKLLIAEDHAISRSVLEHMLRKSGYEVVVAEDGKQAWAALHQEEQPRIAILDWMMPGMDGVELCEKIRSRFGAHSIYIIMLTCKDKPEDKERAYAAGADNFITKPYHIDELRAHLQAARRILELQDKVTELEYQLCAK